MRFISWPALLWQARPRQIAKVFVPVVPVVFHSFITVYHLHRFCGSMAAGNNGGGRTLILRPSPAGEVLSQRQGIKGRWKHKRSEVDLRPLPFPPGNPISIHLVLASRSYTTRNGLGRIQLRTHLQRSTHGTRCSRDSRPLPICGGHNSMLLHQLVELILSAFIFHPEGFRQGANWSLASPGDAGIGWLHPRPGYCETFAQGYSKCQYT